MSLYIVVTERVMPLNDKESFWTWTLYTENSEPLARAEDCWGSSKSAGNAARKFRRLIGRLDIPIRTSA